MTMPDRRHRRTRRTRPIGALLGVLAVVFLPALVTAHPLGNFTINHYAGIRIEPERILLDVVIDQAEIPTFQARLGFDRDEDGEVSDAEADAGRVAACAAIEPSLDLALDGRRVTLVLSEAGLTFPPGAGGLSTMRLVCGLTATLGEPLAAGSRITYADDSFADRLGWREIVVEASGVTLEAGDGALRTTSPSARLTAYPTTVLTDALADMAVSIVASPGGPTLGRFEIADATPVPGAGEVAAAGAAASTAGPSRATVAAPAGAPAPTSAAVPGGVGDLPSIFRTADPSPIVLLVAILTAAALGAGHALSPGHGKTLMAAYLVGTRGTPLHAAGLGLSVTLSHTVGILVLAALVVGTEGILPPDSVVRSAPLVAAVSIVAIGGWMLFSEGRRRRRAGSAGTVPRRAADPGGAGGHDHEHEVGHDGRHLAGTTVSWRGLFVLGLVGGLIPSTSALLILLGSIAAGRPAFGFVLVVAFGLGMAVVMGGIGLALVLARGRLDRVDSRAPLGRVSGAVPLLASFLVLGLGLFLTVQAVSGTTMF